MSRQEAVELLIATGVEDLSSLPKKDRVSGKEVFSVLLPKDFNFKGQSRQKTGPDAEVLIEKGVLKKGVMDKANLGEGQGLLLRNLHKQYGPDETLDMLGKMFRLGIKVLLKHGFSVAISDTDLPGPAKQKIEETLDTAYAEVDNLILQFKQGRLEAFPGRSEAETLELRILEVLNKARNRTGELVAENANFSHTLVMTESGSRGNVLNLAQMAACVGQQAMRGKRIEKGFFERTLSAFAPNDLRANSRGFIRHGFKDGLTPAEFFFMGMTGRDSLMDTALRTPKSGYLYRRLANAMQDLRVEYDNTVRDSSGKIVQFRYGEDGIDVSKSENGYINVKKVIEG